jgi:hypothetical protein
LNKKQQRKLIEDWERKIIAEIEAMIRKAIEDDKPIDLEKINRDEST